MTANTDNLTIAIQAFQNAQTETERTFQQSIIDKILSDWLNYIHEINDTELRAYAIEIYEKALLTAAEATKSIVDIKNELADSVDSFQSAYSVLTGAIDEFNEHGDLQISTVMRLLQLGDEYLSLLDITEGKIRLNSDAIYEKADALREEMIAAQQAAVAEEIRGIIQDDVRQSTNEASNATSNFQNTLINAGAQALATAENYGVLAVAAVIANEAMDGADISGLSSGAINQIQQALTNAQNRINLINSWTPAGNGGRNPGSRGSSGGSGSGGARATQPYYAELEATKLLESRLREINNLLQINDQLFSDAGNDKDAQASILQRRIALLEEQCGILSEINTINQGAIADSINRFAEQGIYIQFNPKLNTLEFEQSVEEIQSIINNIRIGDTENTNEVRRELESMLSTIISMSEANARNSAQWEEIQRTIQQVNLDALNLDFSGFMADASRELENLNFQLRMLANSDFDQRIELTNRRLEIQESIVARNKQQFDALQRALMNGSISSNQFRTATDEITRSMQDATLAARQYAEAVAQIQLDQLNQQRDAIMEIVNLTKRMIQQEARNDIDGLNARLRDIQSAQNDLRDLERDLNNRLRDRNNLINDQIRGLNESLRIERERIREVQGALNEELQRQRELARERQRQLADELRAFRELIAERKRQLNRQSEDRRFDQDLSDRQLEVQRIQNRLAELANNDSMAARAERARLEEELSRRQRDLDNLVHDNDIRNQQRALDDELARFQAANQAEQDAIADALRAFEQAHQARVSMIDREFQMRERNVNAEIENLRRQGEEYEAMINAQIEQLRRRGEEYDRQADRIREQIDSIQDRISRNGDLVRLAMQRIDEEGENLYKSLISWNERYGTGIREDISGAWEEYLRLVDKGNETTLDHTRRIMREILDLTLQMVTAQHQIATMPIPNMNNFTPGIRDHFESQGRNVGWNENTRQFSVDGQ